MTLITSWEHKMIERNTEKEKRRERENKDVEYW